MKTYYWSLLGRGLRFGFQLVRAKKEKRLGIPSDFSSNPYQSHRESHKYHYLCYQTHVQTCSGVIRPPPPHPSICLYNDIQWCLKCTLVKSHYSVIARQRSYFLRWAQTTTVAFLISCIHHFFFFFRNGIKPVTQWAPAGCMGGDFEAINGDSKGKHSAKCQPWWLRCHNIISGRQTQITKINNLIISYSNHAVWRPGSYCSFISLVCWCIPITASRAGGCIENTVIQKNGRWTTTVTAYLHSVIDFWRFIVSRIWCRHACKMPYFIRRKCCFI